MKGLESLQKFNQNNLTFNRPRGRGITYQVPTTYQFHWWSLKLFSQQKYVNLPYHKNISRPEALHQEPTTKVLNSQRTITEASYTLVPVGSSGILKAKKKLGITFSSDKLGGIDFTKISKLTMCSA